LAARVTEYYLKKGT